MFTRLLCQGHLLLAAGRKSRRDLYWHCKQGCTCSLCSSEEKPADDSWEYPKLHSRGDQPTRKRAVYPTALSNAGAGSRDIMKTNGSVNELPKVHAAVVNSLMPAKSMRKVHGSSSRETAAGSRVIVAIRTGFVQSAISIVAGLFFEVGTHC